MLTNVIENVDKCYWKCGKCYWKCWQMLLKMLANVIENVGKCYWKCYGECWQRIYKPPYDRSKINPSLENAWNLYLLPIFYYCVCVNLKCTKLFKLL